MNRPHHSSTLLAFQKYTYLTRISRSLKPQRRKYKLMKDKIGFFVAAVVAIFALGWNGYAQKADTSKVTWEYMSAIRADDVKLNQLAAAGWELVTATTACYSDSPNCYTTLYLKRAK